MHVAGKAHEVKSRATPEPGRQPVTVAFWGSSHAIGKSFDIDGLTLKRQIKTPCSLSSSRDTTWMTLAHSLYKAADEV
jgi:hypothetical protein